MAFNLEEGDIVLCTVDRIIGTNVFVKIPLNGEEVEGYIVISEIAPGRIRNLRKYVVPKKKLVCKILRISGDRIELSLRRVTQEEQKEMKERYKQEKSYENAIKSLLGKKGEEAIGKIKESENLYEFLQESKENPKNIESLVGKEDSKKILEIVKAEKKKKSVIKKEIFATSNESNGLESIKSLLGKIKNVEIRYLSPGKYSLKKETEDVKNADKELKENLSEIEKEAKSKKIEIEISKK